MKKKQIPPYVWTFFSLLILFPLFLIIVNGPTDKTWDDGESRTFQVNDLTVPITLNMGQVSFILDGVVEGHEIRPEFSSESNFEVSWFGAAEAQISRAELVLSEEERVTIFCFQYTGESMQVEIVDCTGERWDAGTSRDFTVGEETWTYTLSFQTMDAGYGEIIRPMFVIEGGPGPKFGGTPGNLIPWRFYTELDGQTVQIFCFIFGEPYGDSHVDLVPCLPLDQPPIGRDWLTLEEHNGQ